MTDKKIDDGGPAYPTSLIADKEREKYISLQMAPGMSFRAYAATQILAGMAARLDSRFIEWVWVSSELNPETVRIAVQAADALIAELKK